MNKNILLFALALNIETSLLATAGESTTLPSPSSESYSQWCGRADRNRAAHATGLPDSFDEISGTNGGDAQLHNVKWVAKLGESCCGSPVVADGKVYIGSCFSGGGTAKALGLRPGTANNSRR